MSLFQSILMIIFSLCFIVGIIGYWVSTKNLILDDTLKQLANSPSDNNSDKNYS